MMENKCNKTPNSHSNHGKAQSKYLDHVYCTSETKSFRTTSNNNNNNNVSAGGGGGTTGAPADLALLKENKQLKTMLILHLDLIQEQDKQLSHFNEQITVLQQRNTQLEAQVDEMQKQQVLQQRQMKRSAAAAMVAGELLSSTPPPLAKIQCKPAEAATLLTPTTMLSMPKTSTTTTTTTVNIGSKTATTKGTLAATTNIIGECDGKLISKIILHRVAMPGRGKHASARGRRMLRGGAAGHSPTNSSSCASEDSTSQHDDDEDEDELDEEEEEEDDDVMCEDEEEASSMGGSADEDSGSSRAEQNKMPPTTTKATTTIQVSCGGAKPVTTTTTTTSTTTPSSSGTGSTTTSTTLTTTLPPPLSRGKQMPLMLWHAPAEASRSPTTSATDDSASCDSNADTEHERQPSTSQTSDSEKKCHLPPPAAVPPSAREKRRCAYLSTPHLYATREWENEETYVSCDYEFIKAEANALHADTPQLEIPKWTEHDEPAPLYSLEGTEDLSDDTFLKRHAKCETRERRRKKWDVQQIREQRRIERLKRRHCKDELLQQTPETPPLASFYPAAEGIQTICFVTDLPVLAFGEAIPKLTGGAGASGGTLSNFALPWRLHEGSVAVSAAVAMCGVAITAPGPISSTSIGGNATQLNSSFVFLKRRRQQSSSLLSASTSNNAAALRHRTAAATAATKVAINDNNP